MRIQRLQADLGLPDELEIGKNASTSISKAVELKVSECLWAKTFRGAEAGDLGNALVCDSDYAAAEGFNPKMRMIRSKTLMQGHDCCNHRYVLEA